MAALALLAGLLVSAAARSADRPEPGTRAPAQRVAMASGAASREAPTRAPPAFDVAGGTPAALVWDSRRQRGAVAADGQVTLFALDATASGSVFRLVSTVPAAGVAHLALGVDQGRLYASATDEGTLKLIGLEDSQLQASLPAGGPQPGALFYHPALHRLASFNAGAGTITLFDVESRAFEGLIPVGDAPVATAMAPDGRLLLLLPQRRELVLMALRPFRIFARWPLPGACAAPADLAVDAAGARVFVACEGSELPVFDLRSGDWSTSFRAGHAGVTRLLWDSDHARLLALARDGQLTQAAASAEGARPLVQLPPDSLLAWDQGGTRLVVAAPGSRGRISIQTRVIP